MPDTLIALTTGTPHQVQKPAQPGVGATRGSARQAVSSERTAQLRKACQDMEALFIHQLLKEMRATIPKSGLLGKSHAQDIYTGMLDGQMAQEISQNRGLGLSAMLMRQLGTVGKPPEESSR